MDLSVAFNIEVRTSGTSTSPEHFHILHLEYRSFHVLTATDTEIVVF
jgi:hypothetical protein